MHPNHVALQAAIVDLDGTLVDTLADITLALNRMTAQLGLPPIEASVVARLVGKGSEHLVRAVLAHLGAQPALYQEAWEGYQQHYGAVNGQCARVYPGVVDGLKALQQAGLRLACLTNKPTGFAKALLSAKQLAGYFDAVFGGDSFERKKPDPLPVIKTCQALAALPGRTLAIGDSSNDAQAARAAGCRVLLVTYGYNHGQPVRAVPADGFLDSMAEVTGWLRAGAFS